jgi:hypothetical protein
VETLGPARTLTLGVTDRLAILELV